MKKNKFSKALKHLKSKKLDEKIKKLDEAAPTNNMSGIYQQSPRSGAGFRLGPPDPARTFVAAADGSWPPGIPGTAGEPYYVRPPDHWNGTVDWETITTPEFGFDSAQGNNTDGLIDPVTNVVKTQLPPGSRGFILGPLVDGFVPNHIHDAFTRIGYIEKDTRQFVLLGIIQGEWIGGLNDAASPGSYPVWDGSSGKFTASNPNFTLDMALWFRNEMLKNRFVKNVSYNAVGGIPQQGNPDPNAPQNLGGNGVGGGSGEAGKNPDGTGTGHGSGGDPDVGTPQGDPDPGKDPVGNDLQGLIDKALLAIDVALLGLSILGILFPEPTTSAAGAAGLASLLAKLRKLRALKAAAKANKFKFPKFPKPKFPKPKFPKGKTPKPAKRPDGRPFTDPTTGRPITRPTPQTPTGKPNFKPGPLTGKPIPKPTTPRPRPTTPRPTPKPTSTTTFKPTKLPPQKLTYKQPSSKKSGTGVGSRRTFDFPDRPVGSKPPKVTTGSGKTPTPKSPKFKFKNPFKPKGKGLGGGADVGATGLKKPGFDALNPDQIGPTSIHKGSKGLLSPKGGGTYTAPKVGEVGPSPLKPGTGGARYTQFGSNPLNPQGGQGGGVIGSVVPKGARGLNIIEPQKVVNPKTFKKGSEMFNRIMKGAYPKSKAAERIRQKGIKAGFKPGSGSIDFKNLPNLKMDFDLDFGAYLMEEVLSDDEQNRRLEALTQNPKFFENIDGIIDTLEDELEISKLFVMLFGDDDGDIQESVITESKVRILREIRQPLKEIQELPKTTKLKGYRPNFKGKFSPQNTPDVTASKRSDQLVMAKNAEGQAWTVGDKYHKGWETTGRMNHVYARVGESDKFFEQITANNSTDVERKMQEHLNHVYHNKAMLKIDSNYQSPFVIDEQETFDNKINDPLFTKVAKRLKKEIDYPKKPAKAGYPNEAPPKIDPNTGMHPKFGKRYKYDKLDPHSAESMPMQGDQEIDSNIEQATDRKRKARKLKNLLGKK